MFKDILTKTCSKCKQDLPHYQFSNSKKQKDSKHNYCKQCASEYQKKLRQQAYELNPALELLRRSCNAAIRRSKPTYKKDGYDKVNSSYKSASKLRIDLWNDDDFRNDWISQTDVYLISNNRQDRPTLDRIDPRHGYEKYNIRMLSLGQNLLNGAQKECEVYVIKDMRIDHIHEHSGIGEAKRDIVEQYSVPMSALNCVDHGTMVNADNGVRLILQTKDGQVKVNEEGKYLLIMNLTKTIYDKETGADVGMLTQQLQMEASGIELRPRVS